MDNKWKALDEKSIDIKSPHYWINKEMHFAVKIERGDVPEILSKDVFCKFTIQVEEGNYKTFKTKKVCHTIFPLTTCYLVNGKASEILLLVKIPLQKDNK